MAWIKVERTESLRRLVQQIDALTLGFTAPKLYHPDAVFGDVASGVSSHSHRQTAKNSQLLN